ncbi:MAG: tetratricopeptide repeat protein, partial [Bacteroidota bacterium]
MLQRYCLFWLLFVSLFDTVLLAQAISFDSLQSILNQPSISDSLRSNTLRKVSNYYAQKQQDSAQIYGLEALRVAKGSGIQQLIALANVNLGLVNIVAGKSRDAIGYYSDGLTIYEALRDTFWMGRTRMALMQCYGDLNKIDTALIHFSIAKSLIKPNNHASNYSLVTQMGIINARQENYSVAKKYFLTAYQLAQKLDNDDSKGNAAMNLGLLYTHLTELDSSHIYLLKALKHFEALNSPDQIGMATGNLADYYMMVDSFSKAIYYSKKAEKIFDQINIPVRKIAIYQ